MTNWVSAILDPLKSAGETAKGLVDLRDSVKFGNAIVELQAQIMTAQQGAFSAQARETALAEEIGDLKKRMAELEAWEAEKQRYELTDFGGGTFAYLLKPDVETTEPPHRICAACYQNGHKSILQFQYQAATDQDKYACAACKTEFLFGVRGEPPVIRTNPRGGSWMGR